MGDSATRKKGGKRGPRNDLGSQTGQGGGDPKNDRKDKKGPGSGPGDDCEGKKSQGSSQDLPPQPLKFSYANMARASPKGKRNPKIDTPKIDTPIVEPVTKQLEETHIGKKVQHHGNQGQRNEQQSQGGDQGTRKKRDNRGGQRGRPQLHESPSEGAWGGAPQGAWNRNQPTTAQSNAPQGAWAQKQPTQAQSSAPQEPPKQLEKAHGGPKKAEKKDKRDPYDFVESRKGKVKEGNVGDKVSLRANYWRLNSTPKNWIIYNYHVDFKPEINDIRERKKNLRGYREMFGIYIFDGTALLTLEKMKDERIEKTVSAEIGSEPVTVIITYTGTVESGNPAYFQVLGIVLRKCFEMLKYQLIGRNYYDCSKRDTIDKEISMIPGYASSIRKHEDNILLCADLSSRVLRTETALKILNKCTRQEEKENALIGKTVLTMYNNKTYRITGIDFILNPESSFPPNSTYKNFIDYYSQRYKETITDRYQPLLKAKSRGGNRRNQENEQCLLVPELCQVTGFTDKMRRDFNLMRKITEKACVAPKSRIEKLNELIQKMRHEDTQAIMKDWGLELESSMVEVTGRTMPHPDIIFKNRNDLPWNWNSIKNAMFSSPNLTNWHLIHYQNDYGLARELARRIITAATTMKMNINQPKYLVLNDQIKDPVIRALDDVKNKDSQIALILAPNNRSDFYSLIKKKACVEFPLKTQVVTSNVAKKLQPSIPTNIVMQMNSKLGGSPWITKFLPNTMFIGYDVCHNTKNKQRSFAAFVATLNMKEGRYYSVATEQDRGVELSANVSRNVENAVRAYANVNKKYPEQIIFYRDGVGEGQLRQVYKTEVTNVRETLEKMYAKVNAKPCKFAFIVVTKRINTRLFSMNNDNPEPGTVVDSVITMHERYDFYLVSQEVRQGTVSPTSYNVLSDNTGLSPGQLQEITYRLCHLYFNVFGTIRVPNVCQYAHKLAFLCGQFLHAVPHSGLDSLFYL